MSTAFRLWKKYWSEEKSFIFVTLLHRNTYGILQFLLFWYLSNILESLFTMSRFCSWQWTLRHQPVFDEVFKVFKKERFVFFLAVPMQLRQQKLKFDTQLEAKDLSKFNDIGYEAPLNTFNPKIWGFFPKSDKIHFSVSWSWEFGVMSRLIIFFSCYLSTWQCIKHLRRIQVNSRPSSKPKSHV